MRDFFINSLEKLIGIIVILMCIFVVLGFFAITFGGSHGPLGQGGGFFSGLIFLVVGAINVVLVGGFMYLGIGIYQNTLRTATAIENMTAGKQNF